MFVFIDESGIHKPVDHSTFVVVYIEIEDYPLIQTTIEQVERSLGIDSFHWVESVWPVKKRFMEVALKLPFRAKIAVVRNPVHPGEALDRVLSHMIIERRIRSIYIDGKKPKWYERKLKKILRDKGVSVKVLKTVNDQQYQGVRLADMIAGLSRWYFDDYKKERIKEYYLQLQKKIIILIE